MELNISGKTRLTGLLGRPVAHSVSPYMHNAAFSALGLDYVYLCFDAGAGELPAAVAAMRAFNAAGFNVTMPNKKAVMPLLDEIDDEARLIDAVNTVTEENGRLVGRNTDGRGFVKALDDRGIAYKGEKITVCGAGGAGRAVALSLALAGAAEVSVFNMSAGPAARLAGDINGAAKARANPYSIEDYGRLLSEIAESAVFIHCTSVGMRPDEEASVIKDASAFRPGLAVADLIYDPSPTKLLRLAAEAGAETLGGLDMLYNQGALAFKLWTGRDMPLEKIRRA
ncbi:MAG: shikimate dehydrogenase [Clostridiales bacterium]|jgi:shikimate dehydrogenase|nr:shikimate dehydrogenase [Clostridiales bacterium]